MTSKATQEYRSSFITLISQLSELEQKGQEFFDKIEKSAFAPYEVSDAQADFEQLMNTLQALETHARSCGLLSISGQSDGQTTRNLATRNAETLQAVDTNLAQAYSKSNLRYGSKIIHLRCALANFIDLYYSPFAALCNMLVPI